MDDQLIHTGVPDVVCGEKQCVTGGHRTTLRPFPSPRGAKVYSVGQRVRVHGQGHQEMAWGPQGDNALHRAGQSLGEWP